MKKTYRNYVLIIIVLSLCILFYMKNYEGFQTSPVNFSNFTGQITGIRFKTTDATSGADPSTVFSQILGNISERDINRMFARCNGDHMIPSFYVKNGTPSGNDSNIMVSPETISLMFESERDNDGVVDRNKLPPHTLNFTLNPNIPPVNIANQNLSTVFNNMYGNLYRSGLILESIILNGDTDFPKSPCANFKVPALTPKIIATGETTLTGLTIKSSLMTLIPIFPGFFPQLTNNPGGSPPTNLNSLPIISIIDETGNKINIDLPRILERSANAGTGGQNEFTAVRTYMISNITPLYLNKLLVYEGRINDTMVYSLQYASNFFTGSSSVPDSVIQAYYTQIFYMYQFFRSIDNRRKRIPSFNIISFHLSNPEQVISLGTASASTPTMGQPSSGGDSDLSIVQQIRKILSI